MACDREFTHGDGPGRGVARNAWTTPAMVAMRFPSPMPGPSLLRALAVVTLALSTAACMSREGPQPPAFIGGGLVARSRPPPNPWSLQKALEGVYDTTSRFGSDVVVHASQ